MLNLSAVDENKDIATKEYVDGKTGVQSRIAKAANAGNSWIYQKIATLPIDDSGNRASLSIVGRLGGWINANFGYVNIILTNRSGSYTGEIVTAASYVAGASSMLDFGDLAVYKQSNKSAVVYLKVKSYYAYDLVLQPSPDDVAVAYKAVIDYDGSSVTPTGTLIWELSTSKIVKVLTDGSVTADKFIGALQGNADTATSATTLSQTLAVSKGGTGQTTAKAAAWALLDALPAFTADPTDTTKLIRRDTGGSSQYGQITFLTVWNYIKSKISSVLGLTSSQYDGNAATATNASKVNNLTVQTAVPANAVFTDTVTRVKGNSESSYRTGDVNLTAANIGAAPSSHTHAASDITSGTLAEARGGTGATSFGAALDDEVLNRASDYGAIWLDDDVVYVGGSLPTSYGGVPDGGSAGQVLTKTSSGYEWQTPSSGSGRQTTYYTTCSTGATTSAKVITISGWTPTAGDILGVRFQYANTAATPTLKVNGTTKSIYVGNSAPNSTTNPLRWNAYDMVYFQYDGTYFRYVTKAPLKTCLYNNSTGTTDAVTLSVTAANFNFMRIYFKKSSGQNQCSSVDVFSPNQKYANLTVFEPDSGSSTMWFASRTVYINGTSISTYDSVGGQVSSSPTCGSGNEVAIYRVEAW